MIPRAALDALVALAILGAAFGSGWLVKGWRTDAALLASERAHSAAVVARIERFDIQAAATLTALQDQKAGQTVIRKEVIREVEKYRDRPCFDDGALGMLNLSGDGADPGGIDGGVPGDAAPVH